jgi:hypothetical protein
MRVEELENCENCENCQFSFWAVPEKTLLCRRIPPVSSKNSVLFNFEWVTGY